MHSRAKLVWPYNGHTDSEDNIYPESVGVKLYKIIYKKFHKYFLENLAFNALNFDSETERWIQDEG